MERHFQRSDLAYLHSVNNKKKKKKEKKKERASHESNYSFPKETTKVPKIIIFWSL